MEPSNQIFEILRRHGVPFVAVGGHAVYFHGYERLTEDSDVVWRRTPESEAAILAALTEAKAHWIGNEIDPATRIERIYPVTKAYIHSSHLMMLWTSFGFVDLFDYIPGMPEEDVEQLFATSLEADGIRYASLEFLRKMKKAAGRTKDLADLEHLDKLHPPAPTTE